MAGAKAVRLLEQVYIRTDQQIREIIGAQPEPNLGSYELLIQFDGGGSSLTAGRRGQGEVPEPGRIIGARMYVGSVDTPVDATVTVRIGTFTDYPLGVLLHGTGVLPTLTAASGEVKMTLDRTGWIQYLAARDMVSWDLTTFVGTARSLTLGLHIQRLPTNVTVIQVTNSLSDPMTDANGDPMIFRR